MFIRLPDHCSIFHTKVLAIRAAVVTIRGMQIPTVGIAILSESQTAVRALISVVLNPGTVYEYQRCLNKIAEQFNVSVIWNCIADKFVRLD